MGRNHITHWKIVLWLVLSLFAKASYGQDYTADMQRMQAAYLALENMHSKVEIKVYEKEGAISPVFTQQVEVWKKGMQTHYHTQGLRMITGKKYSLWINSGSKEITVQKNEKVSKKKQLTGLVDESMDSLLTAAASSAKYLGKKAGLKQYQLEQSKGPIAKATIYIDAKGFLKRMEYHYRATTESVASYVTVDFTEFNTQSTPQTKLFDEWQYIAEKGGEILPARNYSSYKIIMAKSEYNEK